jgi:uncharacterized membrane protein YfcA
MGTFSIATIVLFVVLGSLAGFLAGLLGIGGGIILVPLFLWAFEASGFASEIMVQQRSAAPLVIGNVAMSNGTRSLFFAWAALLARSVAPGWLRCSLVNGLKGCLV